jgi:hypothetical protein
MSNHTLSKYSPRLSEQEYEQRVAQLYKQAAEGQLSAAPSNLDETIKEKEFQLTIDYRLGTNFPTEKRTALWNAKQRAEKQKLRLIGKYFQVSLKKRAFADGMQIMLERLIEEFSKILTPDELNAFMALKKGEKPVLPVDPDLL